MSATAFRKRVVGIAVSSVIIALVPIFLAMKGPDDENGLNSPALFLSRPFELPKDVFDLPHFDTFRRGEILNFDRARTHLEELSDADLPAAQALFDVTAWKAFVALNWPAKHDGEPDTNGQFDDTTTKKVWEYWRSTTSIFLDKGAPPEPWEMRPTQELDHFKAGWRAAAFADEGKQAFSGPLIDQNGNWVHYESFVNHEEFDFLVSNSLYSQEGQARYLQTHGHIEFPTNDDKRRGAIEIKMAWKFLTEEEADSGRFLMRRIPVAIYTPSPSSIIMAPAHQSGRTDDNVKAGASSNINACPVSAPKNMDKECRVGLIGMHIAMHTRSSPQWIWATFEQIDNTRIDTHFVLPGEHPPSKPSLSNPDEPEALVLANVLPPYNASGTQPDGSPVQDWDERRQSDPNARLKPVEVLRVVPPPPSTMKVNEAMQEFLGGKKSVLRFYELNGTQWPRHPNAPIAASGAGSAPESLIRKMPGMVVPVYLTNSTMETYFQTGNQVAGPLEQDNRPPSVATDSTKVFGTESCAGCHYSAGAVVGFRTTANGTRVPYYGMYSNGGANGNADFSWLLQLEAKSDGSKINDLAK